MSKLSKISKISKFPKLTKIPNHSCIFFFSFFFLSASNATVPVVLWAEACPFASSSTTVPLHHGTERFMCKKILTFSSNGGMSKWVLWGRMVLGVMPPVHVQGPMCPDHVAASAWLPMSWLCRFGCPPVQWCPVGRSPPCVGSISEQWMITPLHLGWSNPQPILFLYFHSKRYT